MKKILLIFIIVEFCLSDLTLNSFWKLEINSGKEIELTPGIFTKVSIQLTNIKNTNILNNNEDVIYKILFLDEDNSYVVYSDKELIINPSEKLDYITYIGLKCKSYISKKFIGINIYSSKDKENYEFIKNETLSLSYDTSKVELKLDVLLNEMPGKSFNLFKLKKEIYNIDEILISAENKKSDDNGFEFKEISIKPFLNREELSEDNISNHGILFDYPFGISKTFTDKTEIKFNMKIINEALQSCFKLDENDFEIEVDDDIPLDVDEKVKTAVKYNTEDKTSEYELTNCLKIKTIIPVAPSILTCQFDTIPLASEYTPESNQTKIFKTFIKKAGELNIIIDNLESNTEYYAYCELTNTDFIDNDRKKINITIGNYETADIVLQLMPSKDENRVPQCVTFNFVNNYEVSNINKFKFYATGYCYYIMKKSESLIMRLLQTIICTPTDSNSEHVTFCVAPLPLYKLGEFLSQKDKETFNNDFIQFIEDIKKYSLFFSGILVKDSQLILDTDISQSSIKTVFIESFNKDPLSLTFEVSSTHNQQVECYYNSDLKENCKFSLLKSSIVLAPNEKQQINVTISSPSQNKLYSLKFKCYNALPNFYLRYKTTGVMNMYTYLHSNEENDEYAQIEDDVTITETTINCNEKKNLLNPRCLKDQIVSVFDTLTTDVPLVFKEFEDQVQQFSNMLGNIKTKFLEKLDYEMNESIAPQSKINSNIKALFEKIIEFTKYLTYTDCSIYSSGSSNKEEETIKAQAYVECRQKKKHYLENIINILKNNLQILNCDALINTISELGNDIEENVKYALILINELSNNPDSYKKGVSQYLIDATICLQEKFDVYWPKIEEKKKEEYLNTSIAAVKKDISYIILQTLTNLAKVIHFDELDGYIDTSKTKTGLILNEQYIKIQKKIFEFSKKLNEFGEQLYSLSGTMFSKIEINKKYNTSSDGEINVINIPNKEIIINIYSNYMLRYNNAHSLQILVFDSPIVSVKPSGEEEETSDSINIFISITLYNQKGEEIPIKSIDEKYMPEILYLKSKYDSLKKCFYYDEEKQELESDGVVINEAYIYKGQEYIKCASSHLTAFTAGTYNFNSNLPWWAVLLIIASILLALLCTVLIFIIVKKKKQKSRLSFSEIGKNFSQKDGLLEP